MFVRDEVPLDLGFEDARDRLAKLDHWFLAASDEVYREGIAGLARVGPLGHVPGISRLADIRFQSLAAQEDRTGLALRWEVRGPGGRLFPVLDADLTLTPAGENAALLTLAGAYRPPLGGVGAGLDRLILHRVAEATIRDFVKRVASALARLPRTRPDHDAGPRRMHAGGAHLCPGRVWPSWASAGDRGTKAPGRPGTAG